MASKKYQVADFAAGCFWGVEQFFTELPGVVKTEVGYEGGDVKNPTYEMVCSHTTGHAETTRVTFDPAKVSYEELVKMFFSMHDPRRLVGKEVNPMDNYRSAIFFHSDEQKEIAEKVVQELNKDKKFRKIVTQIAPASGFYLAEEYHQQFYKKLRARHY